MTEKTVYEIEKEAYTGEGKDSFYEIIKLLKKIEENTRK